MVVWWQYWVTFAKLLAKVFKFLWNKVLLTSETISLDSLYYWKYYLECLLGYLCWVAWELLVVIYNTNILLAVKGKDVSASRFLCCLKIQTSEAFVIISSLSMFLLIQCWDSCASSCVFSIPICFRWNCFNASSCNATGITILLPFIIILSMITVSSLNGQYGCRILYLSLGWWPDM